MLEFWDDSPRLKRELEKVRDTILEDFSGNASVLEESLRELALSNGKMLRPGLLLLAAMFGTFDEPRAHRLAAAVEMLHMATLVHDDIIDGANLRRNRPTLHRRCGERKAVLIGDYLFSRSFVLAAGHTTLPNARNIARVVARICASEIAQSADLFEHRVSLRRYLRRIAGKTALLFAASCRTGATEGGCPAPVCQRLTRVGYNIGMGFQIIDDILDLTGSPGVLGKPAGSDLKEGIFTLPLIYALQRDDGTLGAILHRPPYAGRTLRRIVRLIDERGGLERSRDMARLYTRRADREIGSLPDGEPRRVLALLAQKLLVRTY
jgi:heptaprenyl diphosphate synthase